MAKRPVANVVDDAAVNAVVEHTEETEMNEVTVTESLTIEVTEMMTPEEELSESAWEDIQERLDVFNVEALKLVIGYCKDKVQELQRADVEALEAEMAKIQAKLLMMKGGRVFDLQASGTQRTTSKVARPIINNNNPNEIYKGFGKHPEWLKELLKPANGDKDEERIIMNRLRTDQSK